MLTGSIVGVANYATDTIFLVCTYHSCAQLRILQQELAELGKPGRQGRDEVVRLIRRHQVEIR